MNKAVTFAIIFAALLGARTLRLHANDKRAPTKVAEPPYAPSAMAAPFVSLGYHELGADVMSLRLMGYFAGDGDEAPVTANLAEAVVALDPHYQRAYEFGARAITLAEFGHSNATYLRAIAILEAGAREFKDNYRLPLLASQIYLQDLVTEDAALRRTWDEKGLLLAEASVRKPGAPAGTAETIASLRTKLGQKERAVRELREMLLITTDESARLGLLRRLATLEAADAEAIAAELHESRRAFERRWERERKGIPPGLYVLTGPRLPKTFDLAELAAGGELIDTSRPTPLPSLYDETNGPALPTGSPMLPSPHAAAPGSPAAAPPSAAQPNSPAQPSPLPAPPSAAQPGSPAPSASPANTPAALRAQ